MRRESSKGVEGSGDGMVTKGAKQTFLKVQVRDAALCLVGLACYWPLIRRSTYQGAFPQEAFFLVLSLAAVATALVVISLAPPLRRAAERRSVVWLVLPIASTALAAALSFGLVGSAAGWLWVVAAILYGATLAVLTVIWGNRLVGHSLRGACVIVLVSFSLGVLLSLVCSLWGDIASGIAVWLPFVSGAIAWALGGSFVSGVHSGRQTVGPSFSDSAEEAQSRDVQNEQEALSLSQSETVSLVSLFVLFLMAGSVVRGFYFDGLGVSAFPHMAQMDGLTVVFCLVIAVVIAYGRRGGTQQQLFLKAWMMLSVLFLVGLLIAMAIGPDGRRWGDELALVARMLLSLLLWLVLLSVSFVDRQPDIMMSLWVIAEVVSSLVAYYIVPPAIAQVRAEMDYAALSALLTVALFTVLLAASFFFLQRIIAGLDRDRIVRVMDDSVERRCSAIAKRCGLSSRELEIMVLYAQGSSAKSIGERLFISPDTVRTHIKSIYDKMGVHKKQELIDAVRSVGEES